MRVEHLHQWLQKATRDEEPGAINWQKVVAIVQAAFHDGTLANNSTWQTVVLITKGDSGNFLGIGFVEVLWKTVTEILNWVRTRERETPSDADLRFARPTDNTNSGALSRA